MSSKELFHVLVEDPLSCVEKPIGPSPVIVVDALTECVPEKRDEFINAVFSLRLPEWVKLIVSSVPLESVTLPLSAEVIDMEMGTNNTNDIKLYLRDNLQKIYKEKNETDENIESAVSLLIPEKKHSFLHAYVAVLNIQKEKRDLSEIDGPPADDECQIFVRLQTELEKQGVEKTRFHKFLSAIVAAKSSLPFNVVLRTLGFKDMLLEREKSASKEVTKRLSILFRFANDYVSAVHKSIVDWLCNKNFTRRRVGRDVEAAEIPGTLNFCVSRGDGHNVLGDYYYEIAKKMTKNRHR